MSEELFTAREGSLSASISLSVTHSAPLTAAQSRSGAKLMYADKVLGGQTRLWLHSR